MEAEVPATSIIPNLASSQSVDIELRLVTIQYQFYCRSIAVRIQHSNSYGVKKSNRVGEIEMNIGNVSDMPSDPVT